LGTLWNMVGFQTKLKYRGQAEIFRLIPGLEHAQFARLGGLHHNTFLNSPKVLDRQLRLKAQPRLRFAGQITGVEGYVESTAIGLIAGRMAAAQARGASVEAPAPTTALGGLFDHILGGHLAAEGEPGPRSFQPMKVNFGLLPPVTVKKPEGLVGRWRATDKTLAKRKAMSDRALADIAAWA
jgi:methylenetetrahydrofolate--tRNA-(uracil-5-)-methyltransferase